MTDTVTVDFVEPDLSTVQAKAGERGYNNGALSLADYLRDCALGKYESDEESTAAAHIQAALLVFDIARRAYIKAHGHGSELQFFLAKLKEELVMAAEDERLG